MSYKLFPLGLRSWMVFRLLTSMTFSRIGVSMPLRIWALIISLQSRHWHGAALCSMERDCDSANHRLSSGLPAVLEDSTAAGFSVCFLMCRRNYIARTNWGRGEGSAKDTLNIFLPLPGHLPNGAMTDQLYGACFSLHTGSGSTVHQ